MAADKRRDSCSLIDLIFIPAFIFFCLLLAGDVASGGDRTEGFGE